MKMHWCTGTVNLAGQGFTIIHYKAHEPISWPEAQVLMALHGEENVYDLKPIATDETAPRVEKERLLLKYGMIAERVFPGYMPRMEMLMPGEPDNQPGLDGQPPQPTNGNGPGPDDDEDEGGEDQSVDPPAGPAVFRPGKHQPPRKEV